MSRVCKNDANPNDAKHILALTIRINHRFLKKAHRINSDGVRPFEHSIYRWVQLQNFITIKCFKPEQMTTHISFLTWELLRPLSNEH